MSVMTRSGEQRSEIDRDRRVEHRHAGWQTFTPFTLAAYPDRQAG